ncbi:MAG: TetR/AcrR family transcriptional regulator [Gammaproteobacteria bacterium]|nr:TetR/AcrR family transcriptional regulator [Gammaproteobacteria bacterium]
MLYTMSRKEPDTKRHILEATWHLMEQRPGRSVSMSDIAKAAGISRQAVYLHYASRTELIIATSNYVDEIKGLNERFKQLLAAKNAIELLETCVDVWGNYIPEIYGLAKAMLMTRDTDEATAAAWNRNMQCLHDVCREVIGALEHEGILSSGWAKKDAVEMFSTMISINNWEQLTVECGWSQAQYIDRMKNLLKRTFIEF